MEQNIEHERDVKEYYQLTVWKIARQVVTQIYKVTEAFPKSEIYGLIAQLRRAVNSICSNIAEGFGRYHIKDKLRFYGIARGSSYEVRSQLTIAFDLQMLSEPDFQYLIGPVDRISQLINGLISSNQKKISN